MNNFSHKIEGLSVLLDFLNNNNQLILWLQPASSKSNHYNLEPLVGNHLSSATVTTFIAKNLTFSIVFNLS